MFVYLIVFVDRGRGNPGFCYVCWQMLAQEVGKISAQIGTAAEQGLILES